MSPQNDEKRSDGAMHEDGSITLPANPWRTSATWADYNWRGLAKTERDRFGGVNTTASRVFDLIADALESGSGVSR